MASVSRHRVSLLDRVYREAQRVYGPFAQVREGMLGVCACNDYDGIWFSDCGYFGTATDEKTIKRARRRLAYGQLLAELEQLPDASDTMLNMAWIRWWAAQHKGEL